MTICGSASDTQQKGCESIRVSKRYVISADKVVEDIGRCQTFGSLCSPSGTEYTCKDTLGRAFQQKCCKVEGGDDAGVWSEPGRPCLGRGCRESTCPKKASCEGSNLHIQACLIFEETKSSYCLNQFVDCREKGKKCVQTGSQPARCEWPNSSSSASQAK